MVAHAPSSDSEADSWSARWGDPALQKLGRWLVDRGVLPSAATRVVERIWTYYSFALLPVIRRRIAFVIGVREQDSDRRPLVALYLIWIPNDRDQAALVEAFEREVAAPLADVVDLSLLTSSLAAEPKSPGDRLKPLGTYADRLEDELATIMPSEEVDAWLDAPNAELGGARPRALLDVSTDLRLREMIRARKQDASS